MVGHRHGGVHGSLGLALGAEEAYVHVRFLVRLGGGHHPTWLTLSELFCPPRQVAWEDDLCWRGLGLGLLRRCHFLGRDWKSMLCFRTSVSLLTQCSLPLHTALQGFNANLQGLAFSPLAEVALLGHQTFHTSVGGAMSKWGLLLCESVGCGGGGQHWPGIASTAGSVLCLGSFSWGPHLCI